MQLLITKPGVFSAYGKWISVPQEEENLKEALKDFDEFIVTDYSGKAVHFESFISETMDIFEFNKNLIELDKCHWLTKEAIYAAIDVYESCNFSDFIYDLFHDKIEVLRMAETKDWKMSMEEAAGRLIWEKNMLKDVNLNGLTESLADWIDWEDVWLNELAWQITQIHGEYYIVRT